jgi:hypothetical protein
MKFQSLTHEALIRRSRRIFAAVVFAAFALLLLAVITGGVMKQAPPRSQIVVSQPQHQAPLKPASQLEKPVTTKSAPQEVNEAAPKASPAASGMRVFVDPATGQIREPEAWEEQELSRQQQREALREGRMNPRGERQMTSAAPIYLPSGAVGMQLGEDQMNYSAAKVNPDGTLSTECLPGRQAADKWIKSDAKHSTPVRKEKLDEK